MKARQARLMKRSGRRAFTLTEMMISLAVFTLTAYAMLTLNIFSLRSTSGVSRQLELASESRILNFMVRDVMAAQLVTIQTYSGGTFTNIPAGQPIQGNAMTITNAGQQVQYWVDSSGNLYRSIVGTGQNLWITSVTGSITFAVTDYTGTVLTIMPGRVLVDINFTAVDTNLQNFRQAIMIHTAVEMRNSG